MTTKLPGSVNHTGFHPMILMPSENLACHPHYDILATPISDFYVKRNDAIRKVAKPRTAPPRTNISTFVMAHE